MRQLVERNRALFSFNYVQQRSTRGTINSNIQHGTTHCSTFVDQQMLNRVSPALRAILAHATGLRHDLRKVLYKSSLLREYKIQIEWSHIQFRDLSSLLIMQGDHGVRL